MSKDMTTREEQAVERRERYKAGEYDERLGKLVRVAAGGGAPCATVWELELFRELLEEAKGESDADES